MKSNSFFKTEQTLKIKDKPSKKKLSKFDEQINLLIDKNSEFSKKNHKRVSFDCYPKKSDNNKNIIEYNGKINQSSQKDDSIEEDDINEENNICNIDILDSDSNLYGNMIIFNDEIKKDIERFKLSSSFSLDSSKNKDFKVYLKKGVEEIKGKNEKKNNIRKRGFFCCF